MALESILDRAKSKIGRIVLVSGLALALYACNGNALPTYTPIPESTTPSPTATQTFSTPTQPPTATPESTLEASPTPESTYTPTPTPYPTNTPTARPMPKIDVGLSDIVVGYSNETEMLSVDANAIVRTRNVPLGYNARAVLSVNGKVIGTQDLLGLIDDRNYDLKFNVPYSFNAQDNVTLEIILDGAVDPKPGSNKAYLQHLIAAKVPATPTPTPTPVPLDLNNPFIQYAKQQGLSDEIIRNLHRLYKDNSLETIDKKVIDILAASHPEVRKVLAGQISGSAGHTIISRDFSYKSEEIEKFELRLGAFEEMSKLPFIEGKNVLLFYYPITVSKGQEYDIKIFLDKYEVIKMLDLSHEIQESLTGYQRSGHGQKQLFLDVPGGMDIAGQPITIHFYIEPGYKANTVLTVLLHEQGHNSTPYSLEDILPDAFSSQEHIFTNESFPDVILYMTLKKLAENHLQDFGPVARNFIQEQFEDADIWYKKNLEDYLDNGKVIPDQGPGVYAPIGMIQSINQQYGDDAIENFFHLWNSIPEYILAGTWRQDYPGFNTAYPFRDILYRDGNGNLIEGGLRTRTLVVSSLSAATGVDLRPQFSDWGVEVHNDLFRKTYDFFSGPLMDYMR